MSSLDRDRARRGARILCSGILPVQVDGHCILTALRVIEPHADREITRALDLAIEDGYRRVIRLVEPHTDLGKVDWIGSRDAARHRNGFYNQEQGSHGT